jgi:hypothetical protein
MQETPAITLESGADKAFSHVFATFAEWSQTDSFSPVLGAEFLLVPPVVTYQSKSSAQPLLEDRRPWMS